MINDYGNHWIPSPEFKYITNGEVTTTDIFLGIKDNIENWHDTNDEPQSEAEEEL